MFLNSQISHCEYPTGIERSAGVKFLIVVFSYLFANSVIAMTMDILFDQYSQGWLHEYHNTSKKVRHQA